MAAKIKAMKEISPAVVLDALFYACAVWLMTFGILRYYRLDGWLCALYACLAALLAAAFCLLFLGGRYKRRVSGKRRRAQRDALLLHLNLEEEEKALACLLDAFRADGADCELDGGSLIVNEKYMIPIFTMSPVSADHVAILLKKYKNKPFVILCNSLSPEAERLAASFQKEVMCGDEVFSLFERTNTIPAELICGDLKRVTVKDKLRRSFSKSNARPFFVSGSLLLVMSLFTFFPLYYLVSGSVLLLLSILVRAFGYAQS